MIRKPPEYVGMVSSDWSHCLSPCGPFDVIAFHYPELRSPLEAVFKRYTSNTLSLGQAIEQIKTLWPTPISEDQMDRYLEAHFKTYTGVPELIEWCGRHRILFMINSTGMVGFFQRALANALLPPVAALSAHPWVKFARRTTDPGVIYPLSEISDKGVHTAAAAAQFKISSAHILVIGDSGGDGPHFQWAQSVGATMVTSMAKSSLLAYCQQNGIVPQYRFGHRYAIDEAIDPDKEMGYNFEALKKIISHVINI